MSKIYSAASLSEIRFRYRGSLICLLSFFLLATLDWYTGRDPIQPHYFGFIGLVSLVAYVLSILFGFLLVSKVSSTAFGVVMMFLICLPIIGLIPVIFVLIKTNFILRKQKDIPATAQGMSSAGRLSPEEIRRLAACQKKVIFCLLATMLLPFLQFMVPPAFVVLIKLTGVVAWISSIVFTFMLAKMVYKRNLGIFMGVLTLIPIINIIPILKVSGNATTLLRDEGIQVGFFGAST